MTRRLLLLALLLGAPGALAAQSVRGTLRSSGSGEPVPGASVHLRDASGQVVASASTDGGGGFLLRAPSAGGYTLSAERMGFARAVSPLLRLADGETVEHRLTAAPQGSSLEGIVVRGGERARCRTMPPAGEPVHTVWAEARRALEGTESAAREKAYRYTARVFERDFDPRAGTVQQEQASTRAGMSGNPFITVPLERLAEKGYMEEDGDSLLFHAPDARALLSDDFLEQHCFRLQAAPDGQDGMIGLAFEPVRARRLPDIEGVLWLDRASSELRRMEFRYTGLDSRRAAEHAGGELEFRKLPAGDWIVSRWRIRMPLMGVHQVSVAQPMPGSEIRPVAQYTLLGVREKGGELTQVARRDGSAVLASAGARLAGTVYDSTRRAGLAGARVWLSGTEYAAQTDSAGRYELGDLPEGRYAVSFGGARLDSLGYSPVPAPVTLARGATTRHDMAVPPPVRMLAAACAAARPSGANGAAGTGVLVGVVRRDGTAEPLAGTRVTLSAGGRELEARTDARGVYRFCGAPAGALVAVRVEAPGAAVRTTLELGGEPVLQDFTVGARAAAPARPARAESGRALVSGRVVSGPEGRPVAGATVAVGGGGRATTDAAGRFTLRGVVSGRQAVTVSHPAHGTREAEVVVEGNAAELDLRLGEGTRLAALVTTPYTLDALRVEGRAERGSLDAVGFYERQRTGRGVFLTEQDFRRGAPLSSVMRTVPGIRVIRYQPPAVGGRGTPPPAETRLVSGRSTTSLRLSTDPDDHQSDQCFIAVFLDGARVMGSDPEQGNDIDRRIRTGDIVAIEVYRNGSEIPAQYMGANQGCGVVLLWSQAERTPVR